MVTKREFKERSAFFASLNPASIVHVPIGSRYLNGVRPDNQYYPWHMHGMDVRTHTSEAFSLDRLLLPNQRRVEHVKGISGRGLGLVEVVSIDRVPSLKEGPSQKELDAYRRVGETDEEWAARMDTEGRILGLANYIETLYAMRLLGEAKGGSEESLERFWRFHEDLFFGRYADEVEPRVYWSRMHFRIT